jgi:polyphosphate kinase
VLTPLSIDPAHPFPFIPISAFPSRCNCAIVATAKRCRRCCACRSRQALHSPAGPQEQHTLHPDRGDGEPVHRQAVSGYEVKGAGTFRIIRDSDIEVAEEAEDLVQFFETALTPPPRVGDPYRVR